MWAVALNAEGNLETDSHTILRADGTFVTREEADRDDPVSVAEPDEWTWSNADDDASPPGCEIPMAVAQGALSEDWLAVECVVFATSGQGQCLALAPDELAEGRRILCNVLEEPNVLISSPTLASWLARLAVIGFEPCFEEGTVHELSYPERDWVIAEFNELNPCSRWFRSA